MPKFLVTASVDAFANYQTVIHAADETEAREYAESEWEANSLAWQRTSVSEFDHVDFDNFPPEQVADDFKLEPDEDLTAELLAALKAVDAWSRGYGTKTQAEIMNEYVVPIITKAERR